MSRLAIRVKSAAVAAHATTTPPTFPDGPTHGHHR